MFSLAHDTGAGAPQWMVGPGRAAAAITRRIMLSNRDRSIANGPATAAPIGISMAMTTASLTGSTIQLNPLSVTDDSPGIDSSPDRSPAESASGRFRHPFPPRRRAHVRARYARSPRSSFLSTLSRRRKSFLPFHEVGLGPGPTTEDQGPGTKDWGRETPPIDPHSIAVKLSPLVRTRRVLAQL